MATPARAAGMGGRGTTDERGAFSTKEKWANFTPCPTAK